MYNRIKIFRYKKINIKNNWKTKSSSLILLYPYIDISYDKIQIMNIEHTSNKIERKGIRSLINSFGTESIIDKFQKEEDKQIYESAHFDK